MLKGEIRYSFRITRESERAHLKMPDASDTLRPSILVPDKTAWQLASVLAVDESCDSHHHCAFNPGYLR